jgi:hypothetical protein
MMLVKPGINLPEFLEGDSIIPKLGTNTKAHNITE